MIDGGVLIIFLAVGALFLLSIVAVAEDAINKKYHSI